jgi:hypothetical protein
MLMEEDRNIQIDTFSENISARTTVVSPDTQTPSRTYTACYLKCSGTENDVKHNELALYDAYQKIVDTKLKDSYNKTSEMH